ncbi:BING4CT-domain-containing protein [Wilcoxina mikolae CBS 423.85]|nr:BING4CT-domain-containing protein [Wilcoxina mikolae CBS 423.85]
MPSPTTSSATALQSPSTSAPARPSSTSKRPSHPTSLTTKTSLQLTSAQTVYGRGEKINAKAIKDKKLRGNLKKLELRYREAAAQANDAEILRPERGPGFIEAEGELERTWKVGQKDVRDAVDVATAMKGFELTLGFGGYTAEYSRDGRDLVLGGRKGHVATMDWREGKIGCELQLGETVRDVKWLHNDHFFAVAQKKYVYIYDQQGVEIHCLKKHIEVTNMEFLPYHFLLATIGNAGYLKYQDTSTGALITELRTKHGAPTAMTQNRRNAIIHVGHGNGTVTLWSPNMSTPLVTMLTNKGPVRAVTVDRGGYYMAAAGADSRMNIFDIRTYKEVHSYFTPTPASTLTISDTGVLAVGWGSHVTLWKDALKTKQNSPYMTHHQEGTSISSLKFCPFDDVLGASHSDGFASLIIPGAGEPNFDALEVNPYATKKARQEAEVRGLLEKLRPEMIQLDPDFVGTVDLAHAQRRKERDEEEKERKLQEGLEKDEKYKTRGRNSALRRFIRKKGGKNVRDERREKLERLKIERKERSMGVKTVSMGPALDRFRKKK